MLLPVFNTITSSQNPRVKNLVRLRDARHRRRQCKFLIEGERELVRALRVNWPIETIFFCPEMFVTDSAIEHIESLDDNQVEAVQLSPEAFQKVAYRENPDGLLALANFRDSTLDQLPLRDVPFLLVIESVEKPGNLGALMRTANAAGVDGILICDPVCDLYNPNAIRASQGAFFDMPIALTDSTTARLWLESKSIQVIATSPDSDQLIWDLNLNQPIAIAMGSEDVGLSNDWLCEDTLAAKLPMSGITDSLNVSVAAGIALFEAVRQRRS